jgi:hypothetical protein
MAKTETEEVALPAATRLLGNVSCAIDGAVAFSETLPKADRDFAQKILQDVRLRIVRALVKQRDAAKEK